MTFVERKTYYFERPGEENTADAARFSVQRARELNLKTIVVASTSGKTAQVFFDAMKGAGSARGRHACGRVYKTRGVGIFDRDCPKPAKAGGQDCDRYHVLSGLERALSRSPKVGGGSRTEAIAEALRRVVAVGLKVAVECVLIAVDQGAIGVTGEVIAAGGTGSGADTVCVIRPAHTSSFFDLQVREIVAMPRAR